MVDMSSSLAALIGSRICHDLISPIGAINNGLELLNMSGGTSGPEMGLIGQSVDHASARIRFFRIAFGAAGDQMVGAVEVSSILRDFYDGGRMDVLWNVEEPVARNEVRMAFLALLCTDAALPYGGQIALSKAGGKWKLDGSADRVSMDSDLWAMLSGAGSVRDLQPSQVQFALLPLIAADAGRRVFCQSDDTSLRVEF